MATKKKAKKLFTHVGELVTHYWSKGEVRDRVRLRETPTLWIECRDERPDRRYRKPKDAKDRRTRRIGGRTTLTGPSIYVDVESIREATQEDYLKYFQERVERKQQEVAHVQSIWDEIQQKLDLATADFQSAVIARTKAEAELAAYLVLHDMDAIDD